jgi:hypothetical protein
MFSEFSFFANGAFYEITWKNIIVAGKSQMMIRRMLFACWVTKAADTHLEYAILIASPRQ